MEFNKIGSLNAGQNIHITGSGKRITKGSMMKITDSFVTTSDKDEQVELDLRKVSEMLAHKGGSKDWPAPPAWSFEPESKSKQLPVVAPDGKLYVADGKKILALDGKSGKAKKEFEIPANVEDFVITGKGYLVAADNDFVYGFDKKSGEITWKEQKTSWSKPVTDSLKSLTATADYTVYVADQKAGVYAINARTGKTRWESPLTNRISEKPALSSDGSTLFVTDPTSDLQIIDTKNGYRLWKGRTGTITGDVKFTSLPNGSFLYGYDGYYSAAAIDSKTGNGKWGYNNLEGLCAPPLADEKNGSVYLADKSGKIVALTMDGEVKWEREDQKGEKELTGMATSPDGTLFVGRKSDAVQALDNKTGELKWNFKIEGEKSLKPIDIRDDHLYVKGESGKVYSFTLNLSEVVRKASTDRAKKGKAKMDPIIKQGRTFVEIGGVKLPVMKRSRY